MCNVVSVTAKPLCKDDFLQRIRKISDSEVQYIILREKYLSEQEYFNLAKNVLSVCDKDKLIIHNFPETAVKLGVKKIHLPFLYIHTSCFFSLSSNDFFPPLLPTAFQTLRKPDKSALLSQH